MPNEETRACPFCKEEIKAEAVLCKHCHSRVTPVVPAHQGVCPFCKEEVNPEAIKCKHCGSQIGGSIEACNCTGSREKGSRDRTQAAIRSRNRGIWGQECYWLCYDGHIAYGYPPDEAHRRCQEQCQISMPSPGVYDFVHW